MTNETTRSIWACLNQIFCYNQAMIEPLRTREWLEKRLAYLWQAHFADLPDQASVIIRFGPRAKTRLGSIRRRFGRSVITITGYFREPTIPEDVITETIAHELCHYAHGFESPLPKLYRYPHEGRIIEAELAKRGLRATQSRSRRWLKKHWPTIRGPAQRAAHKQTMRRRLVTKSGNLWQFW